MFSSSALIAALVAGIGPLALIADIFYRSGALVFGGGHVVVPLLQGGTEGIVSDSSFLTGYSLAQAMPGPLFAFSVWLGMMMGGLPGAVVGLITIFSPGFLLIAGVLPLWNTLSRRKSLYHCFAGANAAVVGILAHSLYNLIFKSSIQNDLDFALAVILFLMLSLWKRPAWQAVILGACGGMAIAISG